MEITKFILLFSVIILSNSLSQKNPIEIEESLTLEEPKFDKKIDIKTLETNQINDLIKVYLSYKNWTEKKELDEYTFIRLFIYVTQNSLFKKSTRAQLNALGEKILSIHKGPIIVKDLKKYFDYDELKTVYQDLFEKNKLDL
jgi:hypothetical protein